MLQGFDDSSPYLLIRTTALLRVIHSLALLKSYYLDIFPTENSRQVGVQMYRTHV